MDPDDSDAEEEIVVVQIPPEELGAQRVAACKAGDMKRVQCVPLATMSFLSACARLARPTPPLTRALPSRSARSPPAQIAS